MCQQWGEPSLFNWKVHALITNPRGLLSTGVAAHEGGRCNPGLLPLSLCPHLAATSSPPARQPLRETDGLQAAPDQHLLPSPAAGSFPRRSPPLCGVGHPPVFMFLEAHGSLSPVQFISRCVSSVRVEADGPRWSSAQKGCRPARQPLLTVCSGLCPSGSQAGGHSGEADRALKADPDDGGSTLAWDVPAGPPRILAQVGTARMQG